MTGITVCVVTHCHSKASRKGRRAWRAGMAFCNNSLHGSMAAWLSGGSLHSLSPSLWSHLQLPPHHAMGKKKGKTSKHCCHHCISCCCCSHPTSMPLPPLASCLHCYLLLLRYTTKQTNMAYSDITRQNGSARLSAARSRYYLRHSTPHRCLLTLLRGTYAAAFLSQPRRALLPLNAALSFLFPFPPPLTFFFFPFFYLLEFPAQQHTLAHCNVCAHTWRKQRPLWQLHTTALY